MIPYGRQSIDESDVQAVVDVLHGDWLTQGPAVRQFEEAFAAACDVPYAAALSSGTAALHAAAFAAGVGPGDELITSAITFAASANCGAYLGATPRFADIDPATLNVDPASMAGQSSERTKLAVPVHFTGLPAPTAEIRELFGDEVLIVEDAAHAIGGRGADGEPIGSCRHSDMACFSFHPVKTIASGEGGMVTTRDRELHERILRFRTHGITNAPDRLKRAGEGGWYQEQQELGFNYRLSDIHSALGCSQLARAERFVERRNEVAVRYRELLADVEELVLPPEAPPGALHAYHLFVVQHRDGAVARRRLYDGLRERGVLAQVHYVPVYWHPWYAQTYGYGEGMCPNAERYYESCLSLPCFPDLTEAQQDEVVAALRELV